MREMLVRAGLFCWFCIAANMLIGAQTSADLFTLTLPQMVQRADVVVIGNVVRLERGGKTSSFDGREVDQYKATVEIVQTLKGDPNVNELTVEFRLHPEEPQFRIGERAILFLQKYKGGLRVFPGLHGEVQIVEHPPGEFKVRPIFIFDEPQEQTFSVFVEKIKNLTRELKRD